MKKYEIMTITNIDLGEDGARDLSNELKDTISSLKGKVLDSDFWGKRKFAYKIKNKTEGFYEVIDFELEPSELEAFKKKLNLQEQLVRYLITVIED